MTKTLLIGMVLFAVFCPAQAAKKTTTASTKNAGTTLKIVKDSLSNAGDFYVVQGAIYNPNNRGVKNVVIKYYIWKKFMGQDDVRRGSLVKRTGGLTTAKINYLPPKQTVEFTTGDSSAVKYLDVKPDPLSAEITAEWDE